MAAVAVMRPMADSGSNVSLIGCVSSCISVCRAYVPEFAVKNRTGGWVRTDISLSIFWMAGPATMGRAGRGGLTVGPARKTELLIAPQHVIRVTWLMGDRGWKINHLTSFGEQCLLIGHMTGISSMTLRQIRSLVGNNLAGYTSEPVNWYRYFFDLSTIIAFHCHSTLCFHRLLPLITPHIPPITSTTIYSNP